MSQCFHTPQGQIGLTGSIKYNYDCFITCLGQVLPLLFAIKYELYKQLVEEILLQLY